MVKKQLFGPLKGTQAVVGIRQRALGTPELKCSCGAELQAYQRAEHEDLDHAVTTKRESDFLDAVEGDAYDSGELKL